ncbi:MAG TPA: YfhO family protein, partial [Thermodesulfobacteriota bacterium]|nr:YfhO family protein [Thermodesulfobacteriota bacterium]
IARFVKGGEATQNQDRGPLLRGTNDPGEPLIGLSQKVQILSESNNRLDLRVSAVENSLLVLSDTHYPGWKAFVDGKETKIYRADYTFRAIPLSAGTHQVEFVYDPLSFKLGALFTFLGIVGCVGLCLIRKNHS